MHQSEAAVVLIVYELIAKLVHIKFTVIYLFMQWRCVRLFVTDILLCAADMMLFIALAHQFWLNEEEVCIDVRTLRYMPGCSVLGLPNLSYTFPGTTSDTCDDFFLCVNFVDLLVHKIFDCPREDITFA